MSDLNKSRLSENNLIQKESVIFPTHYDKTGVREKEIKINNCKYTDDTLCSTFNVKNSEELVSPGTDVCASSISENFHLFDDFDAQSTDELVINSENILSNPLHQSKFKITDGKESIVFPKKASKIGISSSEVSKHTLEYQPITSSNKTRNSSNFSIFGQLLNKRQSNIPHFKNLGSTANNLPSSNSRQTPSSSISKYEVTQYQEADDGLQRSQMKTKLRSMWNNMKYGWRMKREVNLKVDSAIWLLGRCYHNKLNDGNSVTQDVTELLKQDLMSKIWLTYRINFPAIPGTNLVSDSGWGCMLRSGQMMMAQAFVCHFLERDWRLSDQTEMKGQLYKMILRWFGDSFSDKSPFSLHHLVSLGQNYGRKAGDWYGPTHAAHVLRDALSEAKKHHPSLLDLCMYVASDGIVFKQDVIDLCVDSASQEENNSLSSFSSDFANVPLAEVQGSSCSEEQKSFHSEKFISINSVFEAEIKEDPKSFENLCPSYSEYGPPSYNSVKPKHKSLILFVSVRLGNDKINPFYIPCLKSLLAYEHCIGIIGGRPKHALYFIGWQDDKIIHLDPHSCQPAIDVEKDDFNEKSFHSTSVRTMSFSEMDPSCAIGFYFRKLKHFHLFVEKFSEITAPLKRNLEYPVFALADGKRIEIESVDNSVERQIYTPISSSCHMDDEDDYILL